MLAPRLAAPLLLGLAVPLCHAQFALQRAPYSLTVEAYANATAARSQGEAEAAGVKASAARIDAGLRALGLVAYDEKVKLGARLEVLSSKENHLEVGERSLLAIGPWGRFELGKRRGLPDVLSGYAPNGFTFTSAEFGLGSGRGLDPGSELPTSFLSPRLASQIDGISSLGFAATLFGDRSGKLIYVSPKLNGFEGGISYSPRAEEQSGRFHNLLQTGLVHETYFGENVFRVGGTYSHARGSADTASGQAFGDLDSVSGGATLSIDNALDFGLSATYDGRSGLPRGSNPSTRATGFGYVASVNYNTGPWTVGAYAQHARSEGDPELSGADRLRVWQVGASYRLDTKVRFYVAYYRYGFRNEGGRTAFDRDDGSVILFGTRVAL